VNAWPFPDLLQRYYLLCALLLRALLSARIVHDLSD